MECTAGCSEGLPGRILVASVEICAKARRGVHSLPLALWGIPCSEESRTLAEIWNLLLWEESGTKGPGRVLCDKPSPWSRRVKAPSLQCQIWEPGLPLGGQ